MRRFERISYEQRMKDLGSEYISLEYPLPKRSTKGSAGYDFFSLSDFIIKPKACKKIPLGVKVQMSFDDVLLMFVRSSQGMNYNVRLVNQVGVVDADYYNNSGNEGHLWLMLQNEGKEDYIVHRGDKICQGIFVKYLLTEDDEVDESRTGGIGSTNQRRD